MSIRQPFTIHPYPKDLGAAIQDGYRLGMLQQPDEIGQFLLWLRETQPPVARVLEIGSHTGGTTRIWAKLAQEVVAVDLPDGIGGGLPSDRIEHRRRFFADAAPHVTFVLGDSHHPSTLKRVRQVLTGPVDLFFVDGDHTADGVASDVQMYAPLVRRGGVIAFHDIGVNPVTETLRMGVAAFFDTLPEPKFRFDIGAGWGGIGAIITP